MIFGSPAYGQGGGNTQKRTVSGMVTDENDNPVSGATVIVQGTTTGTTTTAGKFTIQVTPASILEVKFLGYKTAEVKVGTQTNLTIKLETTSETIQDVVVTALGMTRERKSLGYSVGDIKGEAFEKVRELNVINSLAGREPGLIISQTAGGPSGSSHVEIRGSSMLTGNNQPLYVVDGMPIDNTNFGSANKDGGYDLGDGISSINPDDIENISVLKGPAASALYGSQAGNGVIMITTKKASSRKGQSLGVEINSTTTVEQQLTRFDDVQYIWTGIQRPHLRNDRRPLELLEKLGPKNRQESENMVFRQRTASLHHLQPRHRGFLPARRHGQQQHHAQQDLQGCRHQTLLFRSA